MWRKWVILPAACVLGAASVWFLLIRHIPPFDFLRGNESIDQPFPETNTRYAELTYSFEARFEDLLPLARKELAGKGYKEEPPHPGIYGPMYVRFTKRGHLGADYEVRIWGERHTASYIESNGQPNRTWIEEEGWITVDVVGDWAWWRRC